MMVRFARSATLFCWGLYEVDVCFSMPWFFKNPSNGLEIYIMPLSNQNALILCYDCVSTCLLNSLNFSKHFPLDFKTYNHITLEKSSMKVTKLVAPTINVILMRPHMSQYTISKVLVVCIPLVWICSLMLFVFNAPFAKQQGCGAICFAKTHVTYYVLERYSTPFTFKWPRPAVPKLERTISNLEIAPNSPHPLHVLLSLRGDLQWLYCCKFLQNIYSSWIVLSNRSTQIYSPRANWFATLSRETHI